MRVLYMIRPTELVNVLLSEIYTNCDIIHNSNVSLDEQPHRRHHHVQLSFVDCLVSKIGRNI
jgi:hypothetical protein